MQKVPDRVFDRTGTNLTYTLLATTITEQWQGKGHRRMFPRCPLSYNQKLVVLYRDFYFPHTGLVGGLVQWKLYALRQNAVGFVPA